jgi:4-diphosphocytidyl-2-C-methyl-D-erythritol kinase
VENLCKKEVDAVSGMEEYSPSRVVVLAPAKINLSLDITGTAANGYHTLDTVMQAVNLSDVVVIRGRPDGEVRVTCSRPDVPEDDTNIAHKAAMVFFSQFDLPTRGLSIYIDKAIPMEAGLAGGSADAAAVLRGMNHLFAAGLSEEKLREMGETVGADVPFCLAGGCQLAQGRGEILTPLSALPDCVLVIAKPPIGVNTRHAYSLYDQHGGTLTHPDTAAMITAIEARDLPGIGRHMVNVFEELTNLTEVEALKGVLLRSGALGATMSGSGSAVVGLFTGEREAGACLNPLRELTREVFLTKPCLGGAEILHMS